MEGEGRAGCEGRTARAAAGPPTLVSTIPCAAQKLQGGRARRNCVCAIQKTRSLLRQQSTQVPGNSVWTSNQDSWHEAALTRGFTWARFQLVALVRNNLYMWLRRSHHAFLYQLRPRLSSGEHEVAPQV